LTVTIGYPQVIFHRRSLVASDNLNPLDYRYNAADYGPRFIPAEEWNKRGLLPYANLADPGSAWWQDEPNLHFFRHGILSGQFPWWDLYAGCGVPAYTNLTPAMLFPPQVILSLIGATSTEKNAYILGLFWIAGFGTYCLLRLHLLSIIASASGGLAFLFSGGVQQIAHVTFMLQVVAFIPALLIVTRLFLDHPSWRRSAVLSLTYAVVALASFPPLLLGGFSFCVLYFACALFEKRHQYRVIVCRYVMGILLSLAIVAAYYIPVTATVARTTHITAFYRTAGLQFLPWRSLFDLLSPTVGSSSLVYNTPFIEPATVGRLYYIGCTTLLLGIFALGKTSRRVTPLLLACAIGVTLILLKIFGSPLLQWIAFLPIFQSIHYSTYFGILLAFLLSLLDRKSTRLNSS